jgi:thiol-disulfide isomerase/thioredoxin
MTESNPNRRKTIVALCGALALLGAGYAGYRVWDVTRTGAPQLTPETLGRFFATEFSDLSNQPRTLGEYKGQVIVVNFWATWCPPCREEMPAFSRLQGSLGAKGVQFVGIGIDSPSAIKEFALQAPVSYPLLVGGTAGMDLMRELGNVNAGLPYTFVFKKSGEPAFAHLGMLSEASLEARLLPLLARAQ